MDTDQNIGHYTIIRQLGKGGMGEVYLAEDTRLDRQVAIKVLPDAVRQDPERLARFRREAKAAASLQHNNIATIHYLEDVDDMMFIVMQYVDGETLSEHIPPDGMDLDTFFATFIPLADALSHAHQQGRVHRDLKPGNIMVAKDGTPKILDFGLARIMPVAEPEEGNQLGSQDETLSLPAEQLNKPIKPPSDPSAMSPGPKLMGTPQYMSPEQAESEPLDHRTDIFSFGVVMYEALTGKKAFEGSSRTSLLGKIVNEDPEPVTSLKPVTPYQLWLAIDSCLRKDRMARTQTARNLLSDLRGVQHDVKAGTVLVDASTIPEPVAEPVPEPVEPDPVPFWKQPAAIGFALVICILATWFIKPVPSISEPPLRKFQWPLESIGFPRISPDGSMIAYAADNRLWIRDLDQTAPREIPDSQGAHSPFWSPRSDYVGYVVQSELRKAPAQTGPGIRLCQLPSLNMFWATWRSDGTIVFQLNPFGVFEVSDQGGEPGLWVEADSSSGETWIGTPLALPDDKGHVLSVQKSDTYELVVQSGAIRQVIDKADDEFLLFPTYDSSGFILYQRGWPLSRGIWAISFDLSTLKTTGDPFPVAQDVSLPSVSSDGTLVYRSGSGGGEGQLVWADREGQVTGAIGQPKEGMVYPSLSPDGRRVAVQATEQGNDDIWVYDTQRGTATRLTFEDGYDGTPAWSPDGHEVVFESARSGNINLFRRQSDGSGIVTSFLSTPAWELGPQWSHDGRYVVYYKGYRGMRDIWVLNPGARENRLHCLRRSTMS